ncbi:hypothetical protein ACGK9U_04860 [Mariniflexile sp. HNIBRBA6329]|uniref:hypothetical protein n=1 Tax=Mariniflexile sp. HNIBRBA6329 TaxID=3373088 RepID=UPI003744F25A
MKNLCYLVLFICLNSFSQSVKVDTLFLSPNEKNNSPLDKLIYPIINTGNIKIDSLINFDLKNRYTFDEAPNLSVRETLTQWIGDQIGYIDFNVTYNQNNLLSINIQTEGCAAYCTNWISYFNYNIKTGQYLELNDIVDLNQFKEQLITDKSNQFDRQLNELKELLKTSEINLDEYSSLHEYYINCKNNADFEEFALYDYCLQVIEECSLPNAIKSMTPLIELKYAYSTLKNKLKLPLEDKGLNYYSKTNDLEVIYVDANTIKISLMIANENCAVPDFEGVLYKSKENTFEGFVFSDKGEVYESKHHLKIQKINNVLEVSSKDSVENWQLGAFCWIEGKYTAR